MTKFTKTETIVKETTHEVDISLDDLYLIVLAVGTTSLSSRSDEHPFFDNPSKNNRVSKLYTVLSEQLKELGYEF